MGKQEDKEEVRRKGSEHQPPDATERKQAETRLQEERRTRGMIYSITACFIIVILSYAAVRRPYNKLNY